MILKLQELIIKKVQLIASLARIVLFSKWNVKFPKSSKRYDDCIILGNGPSLKDLLANHFDFTHNKELFAVNYFADAPDYEHVQPRYYVINPPEMWSDIAEEDTKKMRENLYKKMVEKTTWDMWLYLPMMAKKSNFWKSIFAQNKKIKLVFYNQTPFEGFRCINHRFFKWNIGMPRPHNVLVPCIIFAQNMRFKNTYLWGADHSWLNTIWVDDNNTVLFTNKHFFDKEIPTAQPMRKLVPGERRKMHEILHKFMLSFKAYFELDDYSKYLNQNIFNATPDSSIDAFTRYKN